MLRKLTILMVFVIAATLPTITHSDQSPILPVVVLTPLEYADKYTQQYGVDSTVFKKVMWCESSNNPNAIGDGGLAKNVMQFHQTTFNIYAKKFLDKYGTVLDYDSYKDQIQLASWMFSEHWQYHWTCWYKVGGI